MVEEALKKIQQAEEEARALVQTTREAVSADLLQARKEAEEIVQKTEAESRQRARNLLAETQVENEKLVHETREKTEKEKEKLRASAERNWKEAIGFIKEKFVAQWR